MNSKKYISLVMALATIGSLAVAIPAFAQTAPQVHNGRFGNFGKNGQRMPAVVGTVLTNDGSTLTVSGRQGFNNSTSAATTFTVSTTSATKVTKNNTASTVTGILVGDTVMVQGTVSGTNVAATNIRDGAVMQGPRNQPAIQGNGQPVVAGKITVINGASSITITNSSNVTYTIDVSTAKILIGNQASTISSVAVGDNVIVQGTVNGNSVTASFVIDQKPKTNGNAGNPGNNSKPQGLGGMLGGLGNFFKHLFGF